MAAVLASVPSPVHLKPSNHNSSVFPLRPVIDLSDMKASILVFLMLGLSGLKKEMLKPAPRVPWLLLINSEVVCGCGPGSLWPTNLRETGLWSLMFQSERVLKGFLWSTTGFSSVDPVSSTAPAPPYLLSLSHTCSPSPQSPSVLSSSLSSTA